MKGHVFAIAGKEFRDRLRTGWVLWCSLIWLGLICLTSLFGLVQVGRIGFQGYDRTVLSLVNLVQYIVPLLGLLLAHDSINRERQAKRMAWIVASGVSRGAFALGKLLGAQLAFAAPLLAGFAIAGAVIAIRAGQANAGTFVVLAGSSLLLGMTFVAVGWVLSIWCRTQLKSLVLALVVWGAAVFVFDLAALGLLIASQSNAAQREIDLLCDPMHVNQTADLHAAFEAPSQANPVAAEGAREQHSARWSPVLWVNPVDLFRAANLGEITQNRLPAFAVAIAFLGWCGAAGVAGLTRVHRLDL